MWLYKQDCYVHDNITFLFYESSPGQTQQQYKENKHGLQSKINNCLS